MVAVLRLVHVHLTHGAVKPRPLCLVLVHGQIVLCWRANQRSLVVVVRREAIQSLVWCMYGRVPVMGPQLSWASRPIGAQPYVSSMLPVLW